MNTQQENSLFDRSGTGSIRVDSVLTEGESLFNAEKSAPTAVDSGGHPLVRLAFDSGADQLFDYAIPGLLAGKLAAGQRVRAPFGKANRSAVGFCVEFPARAEVKRVKFITEILDPEPLLDSRRLELALWISSYYCCPLGLTLAAMVPAAVKKQVGLVKRYYLKPADKLVKEPAGLDQVKVSAQGRAILDYLLARLSEGERPLEEVLAACHCTKAPVRTLNRNGLVELVAREEFPEPIVSPILAEPEQPDYELNAEQQEALARMNDLVKQDRFGVMVLFGVTGSGKTEVYLQLIQQVVQAGRQALVLVPEISLTPQTETRFRARFTNVAVLHSAMSAGQRHYQWRRIARGEVSVVVGARSAIFAPLPQLGMIIVDEEHDPSYKQDTAPRYHGRDVAIKLAQQQGIPVVLGSATPSLETWHNTRQKEHYHLIKLNERVNSLPLPAVKQVDMGVEFRETGRRELISRYLQNRIESALGRDKQVMLLLNRRGYSGYIFCPSCRFVMTCPNCDASLTCHIRKESESVRQWVMCHHCLHRARVPESCPVCAKKLIRLAPGTQRAEQEVQQKFPRARVGRLDSDSVRQREYENVLEAFGNREIDVLLGTQMIGKGLDFPHVHLVGVLNADIALSMPDFRSSERTFQLITQVAGRCGRAFEQGEVVVQTFVPQEPAVALACRHDYPAFATRELDIRSRCQMPPYCRLINILLRDRNRDRLGEQGRQLRAYLDEQIASSPAGVEIRGPLPAEIARLDNFHRMNILLRARQSAPLQTLLLSLREWLRKHLSIQVHPDIDPIHLL